MRWFLYAFAAWQALNAIVAVAWVGKQRKPIEPSTAAVMVVLYAAFAVCLVLAANQLAAS